MQNLSLPETLKGVHFHFVGIKGTGMAALVEIFFKNGAVITGSDVSERFYTDEILEKLGIKPLPFDEKNITDSVQYVVYSSAYKLNENHDLIAEKKKRRSMSALYPGVGVIFRKSVFLRNLRGPRKNFYNRTCRNCFEGT